MSKQQEAPGDLERVREFVNTIDLEDGTEQLETPDALARWLQARGLAEAGTRATAGDLTRVREVREALRALLLANTVGSPAPEDAAQILERAARRARVRLRFGGRAGSWLEPEATGVDGALGRLLSTVHAAKAEGTWERLKACREHTCEWAFFDHTKNRSGTWCNMAVCGSRAKARSYRERRDRPRARSAS
jgi:predicted RNA-binding Zn ribbon-like protein